VSATLEAIIALVASGEARISEHGYDQLVEDDIAVGDILSGVGQATVVEDYPEFPKGPSVLVLQRDVQGRPVHVVWGIPRGHGGPAVLVTGYRPDPDRWSPDFLERRSAKA
jgi:hypothetical protein